MDLTSERGVAKIIMEAWPTALIACNIHYRHPADGAFDTAVYTHNRTQKVALCKLHDTCSRSRLISFITEPFLPTNSKEYYCTYSNGMHYIWSD